MSLAKRNRVKELWLGIPDSWRIELASAFHTFVPAFLTVLYISYESGSISWSTDVILALVASATRAGFKAVSIWFFSRALPDPKK